MGKPAPKQPEPSRSWGSALNYTGLGFTVFIVILALAIYSVQLTSNANSQNSTTTSIVSNVYDLKPASIEELLALSPEDLARVDVARMNLLCVEGLPDSDRLEIESYLATLDRWAAHIKTETDRHLYQFHQNPGNFENSEGFFRMLMLNTVLQQDFAVHYNRERILDPDFGNAKDQFIHGLINDANGGTCASMPVLLVAVARRLGYPLKLVTTKAHLFCRWDAPDVRINIEGSGVGLNTYPDEHYKKWPMTVTEAEINRDGFLQNRTPSDELAMFLAARGHCFLDHQRFDEAEYAYTQAIDVKPDAPMYKWFLADAKRLRNRSNPNLSSAPMRTTTPRGGNTQ